LVEANLKGVNLTKASLYGANLTKANLFKANLRGANLTEATLIETELQRAYLDSAKLNETISSNSYFQYSILTNADLTKANLNGANFREAQLSGAKLFQAQLNGAKFIDAKLNLANLTRSSLIKANLMNANLERAIFKEANLSEANLQKVQALETNFYKSILTGSCLKDWNYNEKTNFTDVTCKYFYERISKRERRPSDESQEFTPEEFVKLFQIVVETIDLIFTEGINWQAFLPVFQELQVKAGSVKLAIQKIERKPGGAFIVRVEVPPGTNKSKVEKYLKREYKIKLKAREEKYKTKLKAKKKEIKRYKEKSADILELAKLGANRSITEMKYMPDNRTINIDNGNYNERIERDYVQGNQFNNSQKNLAEAAAEIQVLLKQLEETYPTDSTANQMVVAAKAVEKIEGNPTLKQKAISAVTEGSIAAFEKAIDNPAGAFIAGAVKGWKEAQ
jgi:uncharacterized protein YjbI with pentapeptide repeats